MISKMEYKINHIKKSNNYLMIKILTKKIK